MIGRYGGRGWLMGDVFLSLRKKEERRPAPQVRAESCRVSISVHRTGVESIQQYLTPPNPNLTPPPPPPSSWKKRVYQIATQTVIPFIALSLVDFFSSSQEDGMSKNIYI